uniref:Uncharacterized protein n=1 Tax=Rhizophora mucronata TaxID=61149 RepID=A0A2P2NVW6_RHIMU
MIRNIICSRML